jgi:broad specificity phosphatase PhoE
LIEPERPHRIDTPFPAGESYREVTARVAGWLEDVRSERGGQRVLVIGHTATRWALDHLLDGRPLADVVARPFDWREGWEYRVEPLGVPAGRPA